MDEKDIKAIQAIRTMMVIDGILVAGIGTYLSFSTEYKLIGFIFVVVTASSLATVFTMCGSLIKKKNV